MKFLFLPSSYKGYGPVDRRRFIAFINYSKNYYFTTDKYDQYDGIFCAGSGDLNLALKLKQEGIPLVYDYANHYLEENNLLKNFFRQIFFRLSKKHEFSLMSYKSLIKRVLFRADVIICSSQVQRNYLRKLHINCPIYVLSDFFEQDFPLLFNKNYRLNIFKRNLFWEGQAENLINLKNSSFDIDCNHKINFVTDLYIKNIFNKHSTYKYLSKMLKSFELYSWSSDNVLNVGLSCCLGIIPIDSSSKIYVAKPENKLILMFLLGLPTIVTPIPSYYSVIKKINFNNFLAYNKDDWINNIHSVLSLSDSSLLELRYTVRNFALKNYSTIMVLKKWDSMISDFKKITC